MIVLSKYALTGLVGLLLPGCMGHRSVPPEYRPREVVELERWRVMARGDQLGELVKYEIRDSGGPIFFYRILDLSGRWVGHADANGRFSRRVPFLEEGQDLGVWALERGCALLFDRTHDVLLQR